MDTAYLVLLGGSVLSALVGLLGISLTKRENTPIVDLLTDEEWETYRNTRLMQNGLAFCTLGKHEFAYISGSQTACAICLPPPKSDVVTQVLDREAGNALQGQRQSYNRRTYFPTGGNGYTPIHLRAGWEDVFRAEDLDAP